MASNQARPCPACGFSEAMHAFVVRGYAHSKCQICQSIFVTILPSEEDSRSTYLAADYHASAVAAEHRMRAEARARADELARRGVRSVYEIGCGPGHFLDACRERGIWAEGIDPATTAAAPRERGHVIHDCFVEDFTPDRAVDAIALWEVVEHLPDPLSVLEHVRSWLASDGQLLLSTPSISGVPARVLGARFPMITPPDHLALFSRAGIKRLLGRAGFEPRSIKSFSGLGSQELARGYRRYLVGEGALGQRASVWLARASRLPVALLDRAGLGTSFEVRAHAA